jgi:hypothetical protein
VPPFARRRSHSKIATPASSQQTASPSTRQERQRSAVTAAAIACPIVAVAGQQPYAGSVTARHEPEAVLLHFVQPLVARGRARGVGREAGLDETSGGRAPTCTQHTGTDRACHRCGQALTLSRLVRNCALASSSVAACPLVVTWLRASPSR